MIDKVKIFLKKLYHDLITINDTPHRIAGGFAVGVFMGILPGVGPVAALLLAALLGVNKVAAFAGGFFTNSWLSLVTLGLAVHIGADLTGTDSRQLFDSFKEFLKNFSLQELFDVAILNIVKPVFLGFAVIASVAGVAAYGISYAIVLRRKRTLQRK